MKYLIAAVAALAACLTFALLSNAAHAATTGGILTGNEWNCSNTTPEYMLHAGGARVTSTPNSYKFTAVHAGAHFDGTYQTIGYMGSLNSGWYCNHHKTWMPPKNGKFGNPTVSAHWVASSSFRGDTGFDIWLEPNASYNTYPKMTTGGHGTELMIWTERPDWAAWSHQAKWKVVISGHTWWVVAGKVGKNGGWERVFMVPNGSHTNTSITNMRLDPFFTFLLQHKLMSPTAVLEALDIGGENTTGTFSLTGLALKGLAGQ